MEKSLKGLKKGSWGEDVRSNCNIYIVFRGKEIEDDKEVGVEHVIKSPNHIESFHHHP